jgi:hypothetical protein
LVLGSSGLFGRSRALWAALVAYRSAWVPAEG